MKFLVDMPLSPSLAAWLVTCGHDALHAGQIGLHAADDSTILHVARQQGRIVITADLDFPRLLSLTQTDSPGLVLFRGGEYSESETRNRLEAVFAAVPPNDLPRLVVVIEPHRVRRRNLPI